ncbi:MAG: acyl-CoA dehydrogenase family protein [Thermoplasmatales archaeon]|nr:acyl-CoA dehydrogenase family protein [Thermoplasmatales archaeon]
MVDFEFNDEQRMMQKTVGEFCKKEIVPIVRKIDDEKKIPDNIIKGLANLGLLGMTVSTDYGGIEADPITVGVVAEELARADISCAAPTFFLVQAAWGYILNKYGREAAKRDILPKVTRGKAFLGIAATEPDAGSDLANMKTVAEKSGDKYIINGEKMFISGINEVMNQLPEGGGYLTLVKTDTSKATRGMSLFYIPIKNTKGISPTILEDWGRKGISSGGFALENVEIPKDCLLGEENRGFHITMEGFDYARAIISIVCCGAAMSALEHAMKHIKSRKAFGQPIGRFEGVQFKLSEHWAKLDALRLLGYKALWAYGKEQTEKTVSRFEVTKLCAESKLLAPAFAFEAINDAIQWFGAYGYTVECPLELALKGVRSYYWAEGALEIMKIIVSRELLGKDYVAYR